MTPKFSLEQKDFYIFYREESPGNLHEKLAC